jgi:hypothetical protein
LPNGDYRAAERGASLCGRATKQATYLLVRLATPADVKSVRSRLRTILSDSEVLTPSGDISSRQAAIISAMGVRAEPDERDFWVIKIGQTVLVHSAAFRDREFAGKGPLDITNRPIQSHQFA